MDLSRRIPSERQRRSYRQVLVVALAAFAVPVILAAVVIVKADLKPAPPVLRPAGLTPYSATANSVTFNWSAPATGPQPDSYEILLSGHKVGSVPGDVIYFQATGLAPGTTYQFQVVAIRGGKRSLRSPVLNISTVTAPLSTAILAGTWRLARATSRPDGTTGSASSAARRSAGKWSCRRDSSHTSWPGWHRRIKPGTDQPASQRGLHV